MKIHSSFRFKESNLCIGYDFHLKMPFSSDYKLFTLAFIILVIKGLIFYFLEIPQISINFYGLS